MEPSQTIAQVALPVALTRPLLYKVPRALEGMIRPGHRVRVPLRGRRTFGFVLNLQSTERSPASLPSMKLREIERIDPEPVLLSPQILELVNWASRYYLAPIGMMIEAAVPRSLTRPPREMRDEVSQVGSEFAPLHRIKLNPAQSRAVGEITQEIAARSARNFLLQGVTGSGKTEVYLRAAEAVLASGNSVLFLVPEIALGTLIVHRVRERFGDLVAEYHSQLGVTERRRAWWHARLGRIRVVVGARSAVFAPVTNLGLIVIDEEHEPSYKQGETPRYHGRDTALMRARIEGAVTILGSATPSLESSANADRGKYKRLRLPERVESKPQPQVTLVDLRSVTQEAGESPSGLKLVGGGEKDPREPLSAYLLERLRWVHAEGDQTILFLNRRGFSTSVQCRACGHVFACPHCSVVLTHHRRERQLRCHYCNYVLRDLETCPKCRGSDFSFRGVGTQRVEDSLAQHLPEARVLRMDADSTRKRGSLKAMIAAFDRGEADILLGTQMVAKGFDFPRVTLVGVINADREMSFPDFRGQERAFQLLTQVAGRAGRGEKLGEVVFQTYLPDHHVICAAGRQDYEMFYQSELDERKALGYPPHRRMANLLFDGPHEEAVIRRAMAEADRLGGQPGISLLGPAPMPLSRLRGQYRWHLTLIGRHAGPLTRTLQQVMEQSSLRTGSKGRVRIQVDMDPVSML